MTQIRIVKRLALLILVLSSTLLYAQSLELNENNDSSQHVAADKVVELLLQSDSLALADSINKAVLQKQLKELRSYDQTKRIALEQELEKIKMKDSLQEAKMISEIKRLKSHAVGYPIIIHKDTLFNVYTKIGSFTAQERAAIINDRLEDLYPRFFVNSDSLVMVNNGLSVEVYFRDKIIFSVTDLDEMWLEVPKEIIAKNFIQLIVNDIEHFQKDKSLFKKLQQIGLALLVILLQFLFVKGINYLYKIKITQWLISKKEVWFKGLKIKNYEIVNQESELSAALFIIKLLRFLTIAIILYISIPILFSIFPPTRRIAEVLFSYILTPVKIIVSSVLGYIPDMIIIIVIVLFTRYVIKFLKYIASEIETEKIKIPGFFPDWARPSFNILKMLILAFTFIAIFPYLPGSGSDVFKGVSVFIGVVFSLGSSSIIGNMVAGMVITYMRPFKIGDRIKIGEVTGNVVEKTPFVTRVRTPKKEFITIPNSNVLSSNVINYSNSKLQGGLVIHTTITIGYDVPWRQVHQILINAAKKTANLNLDIAPFVLQTSLDDFYVSYQLNAHTNDPDKQPGIYSELHENIQDGFNEHEIEIMSPHYRATRDGNPIAIPKSYIPEGYKPPSFKVSLDDNQSK